MAIENAIAAFGMNAGRDIQNTVGNALARREDQRRYEEKRNMILAEQEQAARAAAENQEIEFTKGWVDTYFKAPPEARENVYKGGLNKAIQMGYLTPQEASRLTPDEFMQQVAGQVGAGFGSAGTLPADVQSTQWLLSQPEDVRALHLKNKRGSQVINLGSTQLVRDPSGQVAAEYNVTPKPQDMPDFKADQTRAIETAKADVEADVNAPKQQEKIRLITSGINQTISSIDKALDMVNWKTTGAIGKTLSAIPGTDAYTLKQTALTVRANIGFDRLQAMRDASPTGGALGQVAIQELEALQASIASLDLGLPPDQLASNLNRVKQHYKNWLDAVQMSGSESSGEPKKADPLGIR